MNLSIRKFLLLNLLLAITITTTFIVVGNYYSDQKDIYDHLDSFLIQEALSLDTLVNHSLEHKESLQELQQRLDAIPNRSHALFNQKNLLRHYLHAVQSLQFQVWDQGGNLILRSADAPRVPLSDGKPGFTDATHRNEQWRVYTVYNANSEFLLEVAEKHESRTQLIRIIAVDDFYIMLWIYPISGLLIWLIIGRGLHSLRKVAMEVASRDPTNLEPVGSENVPLEIKPLAAELNKLFLRLSQTLKREQRFAGDAAHELRTPLAALRAQTQVALNAQDKKTLDETLHNILTCVDRSAHVVQQLLTLSRLGPECARPDDSHEMNLTKLATEITAQLVPSAIKKNIEMSLQGEPDLKIYANATAISILMRNLIDNAIRYTPDDGQVTISTFSVDTRAIFRVTDDGPGIAPELRTRVFERFFRAVGNKATGSGLGLAIVQQIATLYNGEITLGSPSSGKGLEVEVSFPRLS